MSESKQDSRDENSNDGAQTGAMPVRKRRRWLRSVLLLLGPVFVLVVGWFVYMASGRYAVTDNAYVKADKAIVSAEVGGQITAVEVEENEPVRQGDVLFAIDDRSFRLSVTRAQAQMEAVHSAIESLQASYLQAMEELKLARTNVAFAERELAREVSLAERGLGSDVDVDNARHEFDIATQKINIVEQSMAQLRAQLGGAATEGFNGHAAYRVAKAAVDAAELDLERSTVRAPFDGVASRVPVIGQHIAPGNAAMSVVSDHDMWIEANYKETDLAHVEVGQRVSVHVDAYPDREWQGRVASIGQATGAEFSVIPAQNASGNWVKVTQRIPVRIDVQVASEDPMLRSGMSVTVEIDTGYERPAPRFLSFLPTLPRRHAAEPVALRN